MNAYLNLTITALASLVGAFTDLAFPLSMPDKQSLLSVIRRFRDSDSNCHLQVRFHPGVQCFDLFLQRRKRRRVALGQLPDAAGQRLGDAVQVGLNAGGRGGQPFLSSTTGVLISASVGVV